MVEINKILPNTPLWRAKKIFFNRSRILYWCGYLKRFGFICIQCTHIYNTPVHMSKISSSRLKSRTRSDLLISWLSSSDHICKGSNTVQQFVPNTLMETPLGNPYLKQKQTRKTFNWRKSLIGWRLEDRDHKYSRVLNNHAPLSNYAPWNIWLKEWICPLENCM